MMSNSCALERCVPCDEGDGPPLSSVDQGVSSVSVSASDSVVNGDHSVRNPASSSSVLPTSNCASRSGFRNPASSSSVLPMSNCASRSGFSTPRFRGSKITYSCSKAGNIDSSRKPVSITTNTSFNPTAVGIASSVAMSSSVVSSITDGSLACATPRALNSSTFASIMLGDGLQCEQGKK